MPAPHSLLPTYTTSPQLCWLSGGAGFLWPWCSSTEVPLLLRGLQHQVLSLLLASKLISSTEAPAQGRTGEESGLTKTTVWLAMLA